LGPPLLLKINVFFCGGLVSKKVSLSMKSIDVP
jgi:hypothetical protein